MHKTQGQERQRALQGIGTKKKKEANHSSYFPFFLFPSGKTKVFSLLCSSAFLFSLAEIPAFKTFGTFVKNSELHISGDGAKESTF